MEGGFEDFNKSGYIVLDSVFSPEELIELNEITDYAVANKIVGMHANQTATAAIRPYRF